MRTLKLTIAYDGTNYAGWQFQPGEPTVQQMLESAIEKVTGQHSSALASGRTDAGVHALGQVVSFRTDSTLPPKVFVRALNANLPHDIAVLEAAEAPEGFRPTHDAKRKRYRYVIHDGPIRDVFNRHFVWHYNAGRLDADAMQRAAVALLGKHDFSSFESSGAERASSVRTIFDISVERGRAGQGSTQNLPSPFGNVAEQNLPSPFGRGAGGEGIAAVPVGQCLAGQGRAPNLPSPSGNVAEQNLPSPSGNVAGQNLPSPSGRGAGGEGIAAVPVGQGRAADDFITIEVEADGFLYNMVRAIVGTLVQVGRGSEPETWPGKVLRATDRRVAGPTAPPQGLCLVRVEYEASEERKER